MKNDTHYRKKARKKASFRTAGIADPNGATLNPASITLEVLMSWSDPNGFPSWNIGAVQLHVATDVAATYARGRRPVTKSAVAGNPQGIDKQAKVSGAGARELVA